MENFGGFYLFIKHPDLSLLARELIKYGTLDEAVMIIKFFNPVVAKPWYGLEIFIGVLL